MHPRARSQIRAMFPYSTEIITAIATVVIAAFTCALFISTREQGKLTFQALGLSRKEFIATHRPRVIVRFIQGPFDDAEGHQFIWVTIVNIGVNPATVEAFGCDLARRNHMRQWVIPGLDASPKAIPPIILISGQRHTFLVTAKNPFTDNEKFADARGAQQLCAVGAIRYTDGNGIVRETGFFRTFDKSSEAFVASKNDEEEYQD
jgi:hypothetical protein